MQATTTPVEKGEAKKDILAFVAAHRIPYLASLSLAHPTDATQKLRYALDATGFRFLHILAPCPTGWKSEPADGIELVRLAVRSGLYPVFEIFEDGRTVVDVEPEMSDAALERYFAMQGRFRKVDLDLAAIRKTIDRSWRELRARAAV